MLSMKLTKTCTPCVHHQPLPHCNALHCCTHDMERRSWQQFMPNKPASGTLPPNKVINKVAHDAVTHNHNLC